MATRYIYLSGTTKWAKVRTPDEKYNNFQVPLYLDAKSTEAYDKLGLGLKKREDEDGSYYVFKRPLVKPIKNELVEFGPPKVVDKDNQPFEGLIGNGSKITVKISVYDTMKGPGHRLEAVRVDDLVEYNPEGNEATGGAYIPF